MATRADRYEKKVKDYNFGSLIRTDARQEYSETNTIFGEHVPLPARLMPSPAEDVLQLREYRYVPPPLAVRARLTGGDAQFYVFEIARNRLGLNDRAHEIAKEEAIKEKEKAEKDKARAEREKAKKRKN